jgi:hypothetical protein
VHILWNLEGSHKERGQLIRQKEGPFPQFRSPKSEETSHDDLTPAIWGYCLHDRFLGPLPARSLFVIIACTTDSLDQCSTQIEVAQAY